MARSRSGHGAATAAAVTVAAATAIALAGLAARAAGAAAAAHDLSLKLKVSGADTQGPVLRMAVRNRGSADAPGAVVSVRVNDANGEVLWSEPASLSPGASAKFEAHVFPPEGCLVLVATVGVPGTDDGRPEDNTARAAVLAKGKASRTYVGRALYAWNCASCHAPEGAGGPAPPITGARAATILARARDAVDGDHFAPGMSKTDAADLARYLRNPASVGEPPAPPPAPEGGWPGFEEDVRPVLQDYCGACHFGKRYSGGVLLDNYRGASRSASRSIGAIKSGSMPQGGRRVKAEDIALLQDWVRGGKRP